MITNIGERLLLNMINGGNNGQITFIGVGDGALPVNKNITELGNQILEKAPEIFFNVKNNSIEYQIEVTGREIHLINEIGLYNREHELIMYDSFDVIEIPENSNLLLKYSLSLNSEVNVSDWKLSAGTNNTYETKVYTPVLLVYEAEKNNGYVKVDSKEEVELKEGSFFYNNRASKLYIHATDNVNPDDTVITIRI